jgi:peptidoglycan-N-acetylglucosamine deacetylase
MRVRTSLAVGAGIALVLALATQATPNAAAMIGPPAMVSAPPSLPPTATIPSFLLPTPAPEPEPEFKPATIDPATYNLGHGPNISDAVVLTYDDCPASATAYQEVMAYARQHNIGLVIAPTGECYRWYLKRGLDLVQTARDNGQYVINHSDSHPNLKRLGYEKAKRQISGDVTSDYGRPPYGAHNATVDKAYADAGIRQWLWDVDTEDWRGKSRQSVVNYTVANACKGCTVLMHLQHKGFSVTALGQMKAGLEARGLVLCRAYRGWDNTGPVEPAPARLGDNALPC